MQALDPANENEIVTYSGTIKVTTGATLDAENLATLGGYGNLGNVTVDDGGSLAVMVGGSNDWNSGSSNEIAALLDSATFDNGASLGIDTTDGNFTYSSTIADTSAGGLGLVVLGNHILTLSGHNTYNGGTRIDSGTLDVQSPASLPGYDAAGQVSVATNATLAVMVGGSNDWNSGSSNEIAALLDSATFDSGASLGIDTTDGNFTYSSTIADTSAGGLGLVVLGNHILTLSGHNTYNGGTRIDSGTLDVQSPASLPGYDAAGQVSVATNATLAVMVGGSNDWNSGSSNEIAALLDSATFDSGASLGIDTTDGNFTYSSTIADTSSGRLGLAVCGEHILALCGSNSYSGGTTVSAGTLQLGSSSALGTGGLAVNGGKVDFNGQTISALPSLSGSGGVITDNSTAGTTTLTVNQSSVDTTFGGSIRTGTQGRTIALAMNPSGGNGGLTLSGGNDIAGGVTVNSGSLTFSGTSTAAGGLTLYSPGTVVVSGSLSTGSGNTNLNTNGISVSALHVLSGGTLTTATLNAYETSQLEVDGTLAAGTVNVWDSATIGGSGTITLNSSNLYYLSSVSSTFNGTISGSGGVNQRNGQLTLGGASNYSGGTLVEGGTLNARDPAALANSLANVTVDASATLAVMVGGNDDWNSGSTDDIAALLGSATFDSDASLGIDTTDGNFTYSSPIANTSGGPLGLVVFGGNTLTLSGRNIMAGGVSVFDSGTLERHRHPGDRRGERLRQRPQYAVCGRGWQPDRGTDHRCRHQPSGSGRDANGNAGQHVRQFDARWKWHHRSDRWSALLSGRRREHLRRFDHWQRGHRPRRRAVDACWRRQLPGQHNSRAGRRAPY